MRKLETFEWWPELLRKKDELSLRELAERFDVTPGAISAALKRTSTTRKPATPGPKPHAQPQDDLPPEAGEERSSGGARPGSKDHLIHKHLAALGTVPDAEVARRAGVSVRTVASFRSRHEIPAYDGPRRKTGERADEVEEAPEVPAAPTRRARPAADAATGRSHAWQVLIRVGEDETTRVVIAASVVAAAQLATERAALALGGDVVGVTWVAEVLS